MKLRTDKVKAAKKAAEEAIPPRAISAQERVAAGKLDDKDVLRCAKKPWEDDFSKERTLSGWQKEGIFPKYNCALYWQLKAVEEKHESANSSRPPALPDEEWVAKFSAPHSSAALIDGDVKLLDPEVMDAEVERRVAARLAGAPKPDPLPTVTAGNAYKLPGSATGEQMMHITREKAIEGKVEERLKGHRKDKKEDKDDEKMDASFAHATEGLDLIEPDKPTGLDALKVEQLKGILLVHKVKPQGLKPDLRAQLRSLLDEKMSAGASEAVVAEMKRLTAAAAAARQVNDRPLALPAPDEAAPVAPLALMGPEA